MSMRRPDDKLRKYATDERTSNLGAVQNTTWFLFFGLVLGKNHIPCSECVFWSGAEPRTDNVRDQCCVMISLIVPARFTLFSYRRLLCIMRMMMNECCTENHELNEIN
jgi:hypothetical protein